MTARQLIWHSCPARPSLNTVELIVIHNCPCEHSSKLQLSIRFTPSRCLDVRQDWYPMYYPEGMKARVSPVQSIKPHRILAPTRDLNREPLGPQSRVVTTILPLHNVYQHKSFHARTSGCLNRILHLEGPQLTSEQWSSPQSIQVWSHCFFQPKVQTSQSLGWIH